MKADKSKVIVLMDKCKRHQKFVQFIEDNNITQIKTDPTTEFQRKHSRQFNTVKNIIKKYISEQHTIYGPNLNAYIKTIKEGIPIRPGFNNRPAPCHKIAKFLKNK